MKTSPFKLLAPLILALIGFLGNSAPAQILSYSATGTALGEGSGTWGFAGREIGFTMGSTSYSLTSVKLPLAFASGTTGTGFTLTLYGYSTAAGSQSSATPVTTTLFTDPTFALNNSNGTSPTYANYTFTPTTATTLTAGMTYWLVVTDTDDTGNASLAAVYWNGSASGNFSNAVATQISVSGTQGAGTYYSSDTARGDFFNKSSNTGDFTLNGTAAVPEPSTWVLGMVGLGLLALRLRSRRQAEAFSR